MKQALGCHFGTELDWASATIEVMGMYLGFDFSWFIKFASILALLEMPKDIGYRYNFIEQELFYVTVCKAACYGSYNSENRRVLCSPCKIMSVGVGWLAHDDL